MGRKKNSDFWSSAFMNSQTYNDFYFQLKNLALNVFKWENVDDTIDTRFMELTLYNYGYALYFNDNFIGDLCLPCTLGGRMDVYNIPILRRAYASNGYNRLLKKSNSVILYNNYMHLPTDPTIRNFAYRLYEVQRAIDVNVKSQKFPVAILSNESQRLTFKNLYMQYDGNQPFIWGDKDLDLNQLKAIDMHSPYVADKLQILKHQIWNEALTFLGIENSNQDKKERLVSDEVGSNYGNVEAQRYVFLKARQDAVKQIKKMFNKDIKVSYNSELQTMLNLPNLGGERNVQLYNPNQVDSGIKNIGS